MYVSSGTISATAAIAQDAAAAPSSSERSAGAFAWIAVCLRCVRERNELRSLNSRERRDIGYTRVLDEEAKPFWRE